MLEAFFVDDDSDDKTAVQDDNGFAIFETLFTDDAGQRMKALEMGAQGYKRLH